MPASQAIPNNDWSAKATELRGIVAQLTSALYPQPDTSAAPMYDRPKMLEVLIALQRTIEHMDGYAQAYTMYAAPSPEETKPRIPLTAADVEWVMNDLTELGVKIGDQFFFLYKGESMTYDVPAKHEDGQRMRWRHVGKREFGECCHPLDMGGASAARYVHSDGGNWKLMP